MTELLEKAFNEAAKLTQQEQDAFAAWMLEELASERRWDDAFVHSAHSLAELADEALAEYHEGKTEVLDPDRL